MSVHIPSVKSESPAKKPDDHGEDNQA